MRLNPINVHIGKRLAAARAERRQTARLMAAVLGVTEARYRALERGEETIGAKLLFVLARRFRKRVAYFFDGLA